MADSTWLKKFTRAFVEPGKVIRPIGSNTGIHNMTVESLNGAKVICKTQDGRERELELDRVMSGYEICPVRQMGAA